jgi:ABC-type glycerol-3-phosphate transport system permease component
VRRYTPDALDRQMIAILPQVLIAQRYIVRGLTMGAVRG